MSILSAENEKQSFMFRKDKKKVLRSEYKYFLLLYSVKKYLLF